MKLNIDEILEIKRLFDEGQEIYALKKLRENGLSLDEAKLYISQFDSSQFSIRDESEKRENNSETVSSQSTIKKFKIGFLDFSDGDVFFPFLFMFFGVSLSLSLITFLMLASIVILNKVLVSVFLEKSTIWLGLVRFSASLAVILVYWLPRASLESEFVDILFNVWIIPIGEVLLEHIMHSIFG